VEFKKLNGLSNSCYKVWLDKRVVLNSPDEPRTVLYRKIENATVDAVMESTIFKTMSDSGQGPKLIGTDKDYRIEGFIESRVLSIWEMRNPVIMDKFVQAVYEMHHESGTAEVIQEIKPMDPNQLGIDIAIDEWGPASIKRIAKMRTKLIPSNPGHARILSALDKLEETYLGPGYQDVIRALVTRENIVFSHNDC